MNHVRRVASSTRSLRSTTLNDVIDAYCIDCHSNDLQLGNLSLEGFDIAQADTARLKSEKMIRKLRAEMMPLAGASAAAERHAADARERRSSA